MKKIVAIVVLLVTLSAALCSCSLSDIPFVSDFPWLANLLGLEDADEKLLSDAEVASAEASARNAYTSILVAANGSVSNLTPGYVYTASSTSTDANFADDVAAVFAETGVSAVKYTEKTEESPAKLEIEYKGYVVTYSFETTGTSRSTEPGRIS